MILEFLGTRLGTTKLSQAANYLASGKVSLS